jgi:short-subunit dehydrogenase
MAEIFRGKWALVTGASSGIGEQFARQLAARGAHVVLVARSKGKLEALAEELRKSGGEARVLPVDLAESGAGGRLFEQLRAAGVAVEHLINNAGVGDAAYFARSDLERQRNVLRLNCEAVVELTHRFLPAMIERGSGGVVQVASIQAFTPVPGMAVYSASKSFVRVFSEALADELRGTGVRMMVLCPGHVESGFQEASGFAQPDFSMPGQLTAEETVRAALDGYARGKRVFVPGGVNRMGVAAAKVAPSGFVTRTAGRMMRKLGRLD